MINYVGDLKKGKNILTDINNKHESMLMDISVFNLEKGQNEVFFEENKETALLLLNGKIEIVWDGQNAVLQTGNVFDEKPKYLQVPKGVTIELKA